MRATPQRPSGWSQSLLSMPSSTYQGPWRSSYRHVRSHSSGNLEEAARPESAASSEGNTTDISMTQYCSNGSFVEGDEGGQKVSHSVTSARSSSTAPLSAGECQGLTGKAELGTARRIMIFGGLFFTIFLSGLDQTVTSTILTRIADDFKALDKMEWVPTVFMLCSTCANIISGRVAEAFGRRMVLGLALAAFVAGAALSATAPSMAVFICARGISGVACGGMLNLSIIVISDLVELERRGRFLGCLQICFGLSNAAGPLVGGMFADHVGWRAAFYTDMGVGTATLVYLALVLCAEPARRTGVRLDYAGMAVIVSSISLLIVGMNIGGTMLAWTAPTTIACLALGGLLLGLFVVVELNVHNEPLVPMWVFGVRNLVIACMVTFFCGMTMFAVIFYMPVYFSAAFGVSAMRAGLLVLPFGIALSISSFASGYAMSATGKYRLLLRLGPAVMAAGVVLLALLSKVPPIAQALLLLVPGAGMGNVIVANVIAAQATTHPRFVATVTPLCEFFLSIGGVIGVALFGAVHRNRLAHILAAGAAGESPAAQKIIGEARRDVSVVYATTIPGPLRAKIANAYMHSMALGLWVLLPFLVIAFVLAMALERSPLKAGPRDAPLDSE